MLRLGSVPYLNARPLLEGLDEAGPVRLEVPSRLAGLLAAGELDVALTPVVEAFDHPALRIVPVGAVTAHGKVESVLLFCREAPERARTVALDTSSRTSADLVRVLYAHRWGGRPRFVPRAPDPDLGANPADAVLLIGDPALRAATGPRSWTGPPPVDLGEEWARWTGLPFVFAVWLARDAAVAAAATPLLAQALARGRLAIDRIARDGAREHGLDPGRVRAYLTESLAYDLGERERQGMERFRVLRATLGSAD
jgi:chorismate dehydratase